MRGKRKNSGYEWPDYISDALKVLTPPEKLTVSEWAEKYRILDSKSSARPGPWRNHVTPYLKEIMDEFNSIETEEIIFIKPTQVGGTEALNNALGYVVMQDPSPVMIVYPTEPLAEHVSENRLQPMLKLQPELKKRFNELRTSKLEIQCEDMFIALAGSNSPSGLSSRPVKYVLLDEVDKYPGASKKEADPIKLAKERTKTFPDRKIFLASTPTLRTGHIWKAKENADIEKHYFVPCPHCGDYIELKLQQIKWSQDDKFHMLIRLKLQNTFVKNVVESLKIDINQPC
ncbi:phage terminase large subunit family protein [Rummeliibacillus stabekisii]|uniref:phage terminase large subunit family protein n=1 Tax=Rummeliibacillus stabekisii TaxID=241244 RepID=UPI000A964399|nr:phage terminase large subunit family protein [Rummeliibacillus stabekisii]